MDQPNYVTRVGRIAEVEAKTVNLALQGGGSHGAFTVGDALERESFFLKQAIEHAPRTSAGAVNAVVLGPVTRVTPRR